MNTESRNPKKHRQWTWLAPGIVAAVAFIGNVFGNLIATDIQPKLEPYRLWVWGIFVFAFLTTIVGAIWEYARPIPQSENDMDHEQIGGTGVVEGDLMRASVIQGSEHSDAMLELDQALGGDKVGPFWKTKNNLTVDGPFRFSALHQIKPPVADFTGQEGKLGELRGKLKAGGVSIISVRGLGGSGKTELARHLSAELKISYPDAQIEIDLKSRSTEHPLSTTDILGTILRSFHPHQKLPDGIEALAAWLRSTMDGKRVILLLDDAKSGQQIAPMIPPPANCLILLTSRQHFALPGMEVVDLSRMEKVDARAFLLKLAPRAVGEADGLTEACGCLPLALRLAGSFLASRPDFKPAWYLNKLNETRERLQLLDQGAKYTAEERSLEATFDTSWAQLTPDERRLFSQLSVFPDSFDRDAACAVWMVREEQASVTLDALMRLSLIQWNIETERYELQALLREYVGKRLMAEEKKHTSLRFVAHYTEVAEVANRFYRNGGSEILKGLALFDRERRHIELALECLLVEPGMGKQLVRLVVAVNHTSWLRFHSKDRIRWYEAGIQAAKAEADRENEGRLLCSLGNVYLDLGKTRKAISYYEQRLTISKAIKDRRGELIVLINCGGRLKSGLKVAV